MRKFTFLSVFMIALLLLCPGVYAQSLQEPYGGQSESESSAYWPQNISEDQICETAWSLDFADLNADDETNPRMLSVSPSGQYIVASYNLSMDMEKRFAADAANPFGRLPENICLFRRDGEHYSLYKTIPIDTESLLELSSQLGGSPAFAWNEEETRVVITSDWGMSSDTIQYFSNANSNLYLWDIEEGTFQCLTQNDHLGEFSVLVKWQGNDKIRYVNTGLSDDGSWYNEFCEIEIKEGTEKKLADLYSSEGAKCPLLSWEINGEYIYYTVQAFYGQTGFYKSPVSGSEADACCLIDLFSDLRDTNKQPYCSVLELCTEGISADGKWACLSAYDSRTLNRDIPLADDPQNPQSDPANAVSAVTGQPWIPCHNIFLYNLETEQLVDPFVDEALLPTKVIVTAACFAPDGKSLLCIVFGDGAPWSSYDLERATFYQVNLADGQYTALRVFETDQIASLRNFSGFRWMENNVLCIPSLVPPTNLIQLIRPAVFTQYPE